MRTVTDAKQRLTASQPAHVGECADCRHMRLIKSDRGSVFYLCQRSATDSNFPKYPPLPVLQCAGYEPLEPEKT